MIRVVVLAETAEWRPPCLVVTEVALEPQYAVTRGYTELVGIWVRQFQACPRSLGKWNAMPWIFLRAIGSGFGLARPAGNFEPGPPRKKVRIDRPVFDHWHDWVLLPR